MFKRKKSLMPVEYEMAVQANFGTEETFIVTGGAGCVGSKVLRNLKAAFPRARIIALDLRVPAKSELVPGCSYIRCDLSNVTHLKRAFAEAKSDQRSVDAVIHIAAALPSIFSTKQGFEEANVKGTRKLVGFCIKQGVRGFVFCSSATTILDPQRYNQEGVRGEDLAYPSKFLDDYAWSKARAEQIVRRANGRELMDGSRFATLCLRPSGVMDAKGGNLGRWLCEGKANTFLGDGSHCVDFVSAEDVARAHVQATRAVLKTPQVVGGKCYHIGGLTKKVTYKQFVAYPDPAKPGMSLWGNKLSQTMRVPRCLAISVAYINLLVSKVTGTDLLRVTVRPETMRSCDGSVSWYWDMAGAKVDLGWEPTPLADAIRAIVQEHSIERRQSFPVREDEQDISLMSDF